VRQPDGVDVVVNIVVVVVSIVFVLMP